MKCPNEKTLRETFRLSEDNAKLVRKVCAAHSKGGEALRKVVDAHCPETAAYVARLHSDPYRSQMWSTTVALDALDHILGTYGVEGLGEGSHSEGYAPPIEYLNTGDTYDTTLLYYRRGDILRIGSWGDALERLERGGHHRYRG